MAEKEVLPRFVIDISDADLNDFVEKQENVNTKRKTIYDIQLFDEFIQAASPELSSSSIHELSTINLSTDSKRKMVLNTNRVYYRLFRNVFC